jgi:hypothetical protein
VIVNRIWLHHFGKGLVQTPNDFGVRGLAPTHPELLNYLAAQFIADGWSFKKMHRRLMLSHVYQLSSGDNPQSAIRNRRTPRITCSRVSIVAVFLPKRFVMRC